MDKLIIEQKIKADGKSFLIDIPIYLNSQGEGRKNSNYRFNFKPDKVKNVRI